MTTAASDGPSFATPTSGLIDAAALHLVVVLPNHPFLRADGVGCARIARRVSFCGSGILESATAEVHAERSVRLEKLRVAACNCTSRCFTHHDRGPPFVQELHVEVGDRVPLVAELQPPGRLECRPAPRPPRPRLSQRRFNSGHFVGRHRQHHALLRLADPDLGVAQPLVLQRRGFEVHGRAEIRAHLADGGTEPAGAAVGDRREQAAVAGLQDHVLHLLLGDGVADLHRPAADRFRFVREFEAGERRAVNAVAAGPAADRDDQVAGLHLLERLVRRDDADRAAEDERVRQIAIVEEDRAVDRGNAHAVAVIAHPGDDALHDAGADAARPAATDRAGSPAGRSRTRRCCRAAWRPGRCRARRG